MDAVDKSRKDNRPLPSCPLCGRELALWRYYPGTDHRDDRLARISHNLGAKCGFIFYAQPKQTRLVCQLDKDNSLTVPQKISAISNFVEDEYRTAYAIGYQPPLFLGA